MTVPYGRNRKSLPVTYFAANTPCHSSRLALMAHQGQLLNKLLKTTVIKYISHINSDNKMYKQSNKFLIFWIASLLWLFLLLKNFILEQWRMATI